MTHGKICEHVTEFSFCFVLADFFTGQISVSPILDLGSVTHTFCYDHTMLFYVEFEIRAEENVEIFWNDIRFVR